MARLGSKTHRLRVLWSLAKLSWQQETAYFANKLLAGLTPLMYVLSFLIFMTVLYQNVDSVAGYGRDEMFFLILVGQVSFYLYSLWGNCAEYLERYVNPGTLDYVLVRPVPSLFYMTFHQLRPLNMLINLAGPLTPTWLVIDWPGLGLHLRNLPLAIVIFVCGVILYHQFQFIVSLVSFWTGRGRQATLLVYAASSQSIPLEGFSTTLRRLFLGAVPVFVTSVVVSVMLGKANPLFWNAIMLAVLAVFSTIKRLAWGRALRQYSSASS